MKTKKFGYLILSSLFLVQTLTLSVSFPQLVLCVAEDHVRFEMKNLPTNCEHDPQTSGALSALQQTYHTDNCADVSLFQHVKHIIARNHRIHRVAVYAVLLTVPYKPQAPVKFSTSLSSHLPVSSSQLILRSVVLLI